MHLNKAYQLFNELRKTIEKFEDRWGNMSDEFELDDYDNPEERYKHSMGLSIVDKLYNVKSLIDWMESPVTAQGRLKKRDDGRYEVEGTDYYFTSGHPLDVWDEEEDGWVRSRVEHNGKDYYIVALGSEKAIEGVTVRARARF